MEVEIVKTLNVIERLAQVLSVGGKIKGHRVQLFTPEGRLKETARQFVEIVAGDLLEACDLIQGHRSMIITALIKGANAVSPETKITILADDLFHVLEHAVRS